MHRTLLEYSDYTSLHLVYEQEQSDIESVSCEVEFFKNKPSAFTQGLCVHGSTLYESSGGQMRSFLRSYKQYSKHKEKFFSGYFLEGCAFRKGLLYVLTWKQNICFVVNPNDFSIENEFQYAHEGWGFAYDSISDIFLVSDGTNRIRFINPDDFSEEKSIFVTHQGKSVININDIEIIGDVIYANVWKRDYILMIDKKTGKVISKIDLSDICAKHAKNEESVLNGITRIQDKELLITGKNWDCFYRIKLIS